MFQNLCQNYFFYLFNKSFYVKLLFWFQAKININILVNKLNVFLCASMSAIVIFKIILFMRPILILSIYCLFIFSCSQKEKNKFIIPQEKLIPMLCDFHIFDAAAKQGVINNNRNNFVRHQQYKSILIKYDVKRAKFDSTIRYYSKRPIDHKSLYKKVESELIKKLEKNQSE